MSEYEPVFSASLCGDGLGRPAKCGAVEASEWTPVEDTLFHEYWSSLSPYGLGHYMHTHK